MKVYVTKYALSVGIVEVEGEICAAFPTRFIGKDESYGKYFHNGDWFATRAEAEARVVELAERKRIAVKKQLLKLDALIAFLSEGK